MLSKAANMQNSLGNAVGSVTAGGGILLVLNDIFSFMDAYAGGFGVIAVFVGLGMQWYFKHKASRLDEARFRADLEESNVNRKE